MYNIGIIGLGVLGTAIFETFKPFPEVELHCYDKYKNIGRGLDDLINTEIIFVCLPTLYNEEMKCFDKTEIYSTCAKLSELEYKGIVILKSTVEPGTTNYLVEIYPNLIIIHYPEFLTARTATEDFKNQHHIVIGINGTLRTIDSFHNREVIVKYLTKFFFHFFPLVEITICSPLESESMKLFCNSFYATKIQFFTEMKLFCDSLKIDYNEVVEMMLDNRWINPMHTNVPGPDGEISFGGECFPKDIKALQQVMIKNGVPNEVIGAVIKEREIMRK